MSRSFINYLSSWFVTPNALGQELEKELEPVLFLVSPTELLSVKLKPVTSCIPSPARNMPSKLGITKFQLHMLNKSQLQQILSVKLKPIVKQHKIAIFEPRHPVLKELLNKCPIVY